MGHRAVLSGVRHWLRPIALGAVVACGSDGGEVSVPRADEMCDDGEPARCGFGEGASAKQNAVLVCDGGAWSVAVDCGNEETCADDDGRGAVVCTDELDQVIYGEHGGPCSVAGARSCSFALDYVLACEAGKWAIDTNCSTDVLHCTFVTSQDQADCTDQDGCLVCA